MVLWFRLFIFYRYLKIPIGEGIGHFIGAMRVDAFRPAT